jgi:hypothetical protein
MGDIMRIYLKQAQQVGEVSYPMAGFYNNVPDELARQWFGAGLAVPAMDDNEIVNPFAPSASVVETSGHTVEGKAVNHEEDR